MNFNLNSFETDLPEKKFLYYFISYLGMLINIVQYISLIL